MRDTVTVVSLSIVFFLLASLNIGFNEIPSSGWKVSGNNSFYLDLNGEKNVSEILFFQKKGEINLNIYIGQPENWGAKKTILISDYYKWRSLDINSPTPFLKIDIVKSKGELLEIAIIEEGHHIENLSLYSENGEKGSLLHLIDEQDLVAFPITYKSETVFDEIHYVKAAKAFLSKESYETTHPPLGNIIIAVGISVFGFNPFGWRIMGVIFATSMIPIMYFLGKEMSGSWLGGFVSSVLLVFDFMHFTLSRVATIETFLVFFLLGAQFFFYKYILDVLKTGWSASLHPYFVAIFLLAIAFSIKWTAVFSLIGQLFYLYLLSLNVNQKKVGKKYSSLSTHKIIYVISGTIVVFGVVYILSYVPYMSLGNSLKDVYYRQWYMLSYHSELTATHPFSSPWWSWPLITRPIWLYISKLGEGYVSTITLMGNPLGWWIGLVSLITIAEKAIKEKCPSYVYLVAMFVIQWIPYVFISRVSFLYYFYPNIIILSLCTSTQICEYWKERKETWKVLLYLILYVSFFALYYPVISGNKISVWWKDVLRLLPSWVF